MSKKHKLEDLVKHGKDVGDLSISDLNLPDWMKGVLEEPDEVNSDSPTLPFSPLEGTERG